MPEENPRGTFQPEIPGRQPMDYHDRIRVDSEVMLGKPTIKGTRITVEQVLRKLSEGASISDLLEAFPHLQREDVLAALSYGADVISREELVVG